MKRLCILAGLVASLGPGCKKAEKEKSTESAKQAAQPAASKPAPAHPTPSHGAPRAKKGMAAQGKVSETMNAGGYTYVKLDGAEGAIWAAAPETTVKVGDEVSFAGGMPMQGFHSNTLNRTFDMVYFVPGLTINGAKPAVPKAAGAAAAAGGAPQAMDLSGIARAEGGKTIEEIFARKAELAGKELSVRGKVVKFNAGILGRNWIHIQDGTGQAGSNDLTVTTDATAKLGATILVKGKVALDKDFGAGSKYALIVEDAAITVE